MSWRLLRYRLPLTRPLTTGAADDHRVGLIVERTEGGRVGYGEAAPLPGLHTETLEDIKADLIAVLRAGAPPRSMLSRHALQCAAVWGERAAEAVEFNALIDGADPVGSAVRAARRGHTTIKLKVGRGSIDGDLAALAGIRARLPEVAIRLDANQAWSLPEAIEFCRAAAPHRIAYIEEPLRDPGQLTALHRATGVPLALDESLSTGQIPEGAVAMVLKPSVLSLSGCRALIGRHRLTPIISGAFESGIARTAHLALAAGSRAVSGLSTAGWLGEDLLDPPPRPVGPRYLPGPPAAVRADLLTEVAAG